MSSTSTPNLDIQDKDIREANPANTIPWRRLGLEALPDHETLFLSTERLVVAGADHLMRSARRLVKSIQHVGILQSPSVVMREGIDIHDAGAVFEVIAGRRRVLAARLAGLAVVKCEVYVASTIPLSALLALIENEQRSAAWIREVEALRCLIDEGVGLTLDDLAAFGFDRATLAERLKIAQLPRPLVQRVLAGSVNREIARKLVRLTQAQQERIARLAEAGEEITAERVHDLLRAQINAGFAPIQAALADGWHDHSPGHPSEPPGVSLQPVFPTDPHDEEQTGPATDGGSEPAAERCPSVTMLLAALRTFAHSPDYRTMPPPVQTLTRALEQQLHLALREADPASHSHSTVQPHS